MRRRTLYRAAMRRGSIVRRPSRARWIVNGTLFIVTLMLINPLAASVDTNNNKFLTPQGIYDTGPIPIVHSYPGTGVGFERMILHDPFGPEAHVDPPSPPGASLATTKPFRPAFFDIFVEWQMIGPGGGGSGGVLRTLAHGSAIIIEPDVPGIWDTELLQLDLSSDGMMIRESPTLPSLGRQTATELGGGMYRIDSFFDVFTELSVDGGQSWIPSAGSAHIALDGISPEPGSALLIGVGAALMLKRRRE